MVSHLKDPAEIYARSFAIIREAADLSAFDVPLGDVAVRLIHACGMPDIVDDIAASADFLASAGQAIAGGAPLFCDCEMVASGITRRFLTAGNDVVVTLNDARTSQLASDLGTTRSAAAVDLWGDRLVGALVVIGNAPTTLFRCLEVIAEGGPRPAAIIGCPVGFVGAAESKQALAESDLPSLVVHGTRGGSAMASSVVNAIALVKAGGDG